MQLQPLYAMIYYKRSPMSVLERTVQTALREMGPLRQFDRGVTRNTHCQPAGHDQMTSSPLAAHGRL
jgi:hypothetical protein